MPYTDDKTFKAELVGELKAKNVVIQNPDSISLVEMLKQYRDVLKKELDVIDNNRTHESYFYNSWDALNEKLKHTNPNSAELYTLYSRCKDDLADLLILKKNLYQFLGHHNYYRGGQVSLGNSSASVLLDDFQKLMKERLDAIAAGYKDINGQPINDAVAKPLYSKLNELRRACENKASPKEIDNLCRQCADHWQQEQQKLESLKEKVLLADLAKKVRNPAPPNNVTAMLRQYDTQLTERLRVLGPSSENFFNPDLNSFRTACRATPPDFARIHEAFAKLEHALSKQEELMVKLMVTTDLIKNKTVVFVPADWTGTNEAYLEKTKQNLDTVTNGSGASTERMAVTQAEWNAMLPQYLAKVKEKLDVLRQYQAPGLNDEAYYRHYQQLQVAFADTNSRDYSKILESLHKCNEQIRQLEAAKQSQQNPRLDVHSGSREPHPEPTRGEVRRPVPKTHQVEAGPPAVTFKEEASGFHYQMPNRSDAEAYKVHERVLPETIKKMVQEARAAYGDKLHVGAGSSKELAEAFYKECMQQRVSCTVARDCPFQPPPRDDSSSSLHLTHT